ncbi:MAG: alkaline phosphatase family protein [Opitutaceae bacterium]|nr:alkaline phosphatase family protein [Opitutaceae bacterium]
MPTPARKVLLIGWDAADWNVARPLLEQGKLPALQRLMAAGVWGDLATIRPVLSPMLWTSIATGKRAWKHGIHGFAEPCPATGDIRPITNLSRKTKAVWNIFSQHGWRSNVIGWWPSHPAEPIRGVMISNQFQQAVRNLGEDWPMRPGTVHPAALAEPLQAMRIHPAELENEHLLPFIPRAAEIDQAKDRRMETCARIIAEVSGIHAAATACLQLEPWEFAAVYYDGIDHFGHGFMKYHPPRQPWIGERDFELYNGVIEAAYRYHDMMLDTLLRIAGDDTTVMLISDHGFESGNLRPRGLPNEPAAPAAEHSPFGLFVLRGPGIKAGERIHGATLLDIAPTLLHLYGLPVGRDMDGKVLVNCFAAPTAPEFVESWDDIAGEDGRHPAQTQLDPIESREALRQLVELGYIEEADSDRGKAIDETLRELQFNLAQAYMDGGRYGAAAEILEQLWQRWPEESRFGVRLLNCALALGETAWARATFDLLLARKQEHATKATAELRLLAAGPKPVVEAAKADSAAVKEPDPRTQAKLRRLQARAGTNVAALAFMHARVLALEGRPEEALASLDGAAEADASHQPSLLAKRGEVLRTLRRWDEAEAAYRELCRIDPRNPEGHLGLARCDLAHRRPYEAAAHALRALELDFHHAQARHVYAKALIRVGQPRFAEQVLKTAVSELPNFAHAHALLALIYRRWLKDEPASARHRELARETARTNQERRRGVSLRRSDAGTGPVAFPQLEPITGRLAAGDASAPPLIVVSGLPRSGTSLMMQMLAAGGVAIVSDGSRAADDSNPRGYLEDDRVKRLLTTADRTWLHVERGKAIKIVAPLLHAIPPDLACKVIFMERSAAEVVGSQRKMLQRHGRDGARLDDATLARTLAAHLDATHALCRSRPNIELLPLGYAATVADPTDAARRIANFLGLPLDEAAMAAVADPALYRTGRS